MFPYWAAYVYEHFMQLLEGNFALFCIYNLGFRNDFQNVLLVIMVSKAFCPFSMLKDYYLMIHYHRKVVKYPEYWQPDYCLRKIRSCSSCFFWTSSCSFVLELLVFKPTFHMEFMFRKRGLLLSCKPNTVELLFFCLSDYSNPFSGRCNE